MFKELMPLMAERKVHILLATTSEGKITLYIEPASRGKPDETDAVVTPIRVQATPEELDEQLPAILKEWVESRSRICSSLQEALNASKKEMEQRAEDAKKKVAGNTKTSNAAATKSNKAVPPKATTGRTTIETNKEADGKEDVVTSVSQAAATVIAPGNTESLFG